MNLNNKKIFKYYFFISSIILIVALSFKSPVDIVTLNSYLEHNNWQAADRETEMLLLRKISRKSDLHIWLLREIGLPIYDPDEIDYSSCELIRSIDRTWLTYSKNKYGFSVQEKIYQSLYPEKNAKDNYSYSLQKYSKTAIKLKWIKDHSIVPYNHALINFSLNSPAGHLPSWVWTGEATREWYIENTEHLKYSKLFSCLHKNSH